jgi:excisionase family DNA binding protein
MTVKEAMAYLKVSRVTLYALMTRGQLRWVEVEGVRGRRFRREDLDRLIREGGKQ